MNSKTPRIDPSPPVIKRSDSRQDTIEVTYDFAEQEYVATLWWRERGNKAITIGRDGLAKLRLDIASFRRVWSNPVKVVSLHADAKKKPGVGRGNPNFGSAKKYTPTARAAKILRELEAAAKEAKLTMGSGSHNRFKGEPIPKEWWPKVLAKPTAVGIPLSAMSLALGASKSYMHDCKRRDRMRADVREIMEKVMADGK